MNNVAAPVVVWFRLDLRLEDNPAVAAAHATGRAVVPVYVWAPEDEGEWAPGAASRWWLHYSLGSLARELEQRGSRLILLRGPAEKALVELVEKCGAEEVFFNRRYEPALRKQEQRVTAALKKAGRNVQTGNSALLIDVEAVRTTQDGVYHVFTPFWNAMRGKVDASRIAAAPRKLAAPEQWPEGVKLESLGLLPKIDWAGGIEAEWTPGEAGAHGRLSAFLKEPVAHYPEQHDLPAVEGTSRLSPHLHFGEIGPRQVWAALSEHEEMSRASGYTRGAEAHKRQLGWREFSHYMLWHHPETADEPLRPEFRKFPWRRSERKLRAWQRGRTGYPIVDAAMRELWRIGWMHNRMRMVAASFLVKDLLQPWQAGAKWFWDTLVDADLANNTMGFQWTAGCGADAAPYFRVFNPVLQGKKFDAQGEYVRRWVPELAGLSDKHVHEPWEMDALEAAESGCELGGEGGYGERIVEHGRARDEALEAYAKIRAEKTD